MAYELNFGQENRAEKIRDLAGAYAELSQPVEESTEKLQRQESALNNLSAASSRFFGDWNRSTQAAAQSQSAWAKGMDELGNKFTQLEDKFPVAALKSFSNRMGQALSDTVSGANSAKDAFSSLAEGFLNDINRMISRMVAMYIMQQTMAGVGAMGFAEGGVIPGHFTPITPMQEGGIYNRPTLGLVAEAGYPEAVIPMKHGYVPVKVIGDNQAASGQSKPTYIVNAFSEDFLQQEINRALSKNADVIVNVVQRDIASQGNTYRMIRGINR